jgi:ABC-type antimicrobial peptide transport system permease subunit
MQVPAGEFSFTRLEKVIFGAGSIAKIGQELDRRGLTRAVVVTGKSLGVQPPAASWGGMLARAYNYIEIAPEQMYAPGLAILLTALAFNALGESIRVALDPTMKRR